MDKPAPPEPATTLREDLRRVDAQIVADRHDRLLRKLLRARKRVVADVEPG